MKSMNISDSDGSNRCARSGYAASQRGAAALVITLILVIVAGLSSLLVNKAAFNEQQLSGNDTRSKEVYSAAKGALDYNTAWLQAALELPKVYDIGWNDVDVDGFGVTGATANPPAFANSVDGAATLIQGVDTYSVASPVTYTLLTDEADSPMLVEVSSTATALADTQITRTLTRRFIVSNFVTSSIGKAPPLVVEGCITDVTGTPDIIADGVAIATFDGDASPACIDQGHFDIVGDGTIEDADPNNEFGGSFHQMFFGGVPKSELKRMSDEEEAAGVPMRDRTIVFVEAGDDPADPWHDDLGNGTDIAGVLTLDYPVILYFDKSLGCPTINGNVTIWGLVFYEASSCDVNEGAQGGGKLKVYGTLAFSGDLTKFNANAEIYELDLSDIPDDEKPKKILAVMPGSWKDW